MLLYAGERGLYLDRGQERELKRRLRQGMSEERLRADIENAVGARR